MAQKVTIITNEYMGEFGGGNPKEIVYRTEGEFKIEYIGTDIEFIKLTDSTKVGFKLISTNFKELTLEDI